MKFQSYHIESLHHNRCFYQTGVTKVTFNHDNRNN